MGCLHNGRCLDNMFHHDSPLGRSIIFISKEPGTNKLTANTAAGVRFFCTIDKLGLGQRHQRDGRIARKVDRFCDIRGIV
jgi:hypothetical protein